VVGGLDYQTIDSICSWVAAHGFNVIRLPVSVELLLNGDSIQVYDYLTRNPTLQGMTASQIIYQVITTAGQYGLKVILDCHRLDAGWSTQDNGLWYTDVYSESDWLNAWAKLVSTYQSVLAPDGSPIVIGCDLQNEPGANSPAIDLYTRQNGTAPTLPDPSLPYPENVSAQNKGSLWHIERDPTYPMDWAKAAQTAGSTILGVNPNLLIFVEGVRWDPSGPASNGNNYWFGGNLTGVGDPNRGGISLSRGIGGPPVTNKLVYSIHDYGPRLYSGLPWCQLSSQPGPYSGSANTPAMCFQTWDQTWGYIAAHNIAPLWLGEFGTANGYYGWYQGMDPSTPTDPNPQNVYTDVIADQSGKVQYAQGAWFSYLVQYLQQRGIHWCYWSLNGTQSQAPTRDPSASDWYGILKPDWSDWASAPMRAKLQTIM
jgi:aryl-phospho-beta-D-glucosidase BglC (GH1 family)